MRWNNDIEIDWHWHAYSIARKIFRKLYKGYSCVNCRGVARPDMIDCVIEAIIGMHTNYRKRGSNGKV